MVLLDWISLASVFLASSALAAMSGLILHRWLKSWQERKQTARSGWLTNLALEYLEEPGDVSRLKNQLQRGDHHLLVRLIANLLPKVRGEYAAAIIELMRELGVVDSCLHHLRLRGWWERVRACAELGSFNEPRVVAALYQALEDPKIDVRVAAARSLIQLGAVPPVRTLLDSLAVGHQSHSLVLNDIFRSLDSRAVPELISVLESDASHAAKLLAIDALGRIGDLQAVPTLLKLSRHPQTRVRAAIMQAIGLLVDPRALSAVLQGLEDPAWEVRSQAATAAGLLGAREALAALELRLDDEQWWVRYHAAEALFTLGETGLAALHAAARASGERMADIAQGLLREKGLAF